MDPIRWQQIDKLLDEVLDREPDQRQAFLEQACAGDEDLHREVGALLAAHEKAGSFVETPALNLAARALAQKQAQLLAGRRLGSHEILSLLGRGGMGEVYRARDTRLDRQVAIKVLPEAFTGDPERLARFEREAKLLASLNHPNIAAIHGLEEAEGQRFLVLELVEGRTLAERIKKGPLPLEEALGICRQIAEGAEAAHEKGIIHRDLKPANIKITPEGKVKILDFGLAKAYEKEKSAPDISKSPTLTDEITGPGMILGTAAYISPEQATGRAVDKRTDIWAFGCVLFECLTGKRAFEGETVTETLAAILKNEPDWSQLPSETPALVRSLLHRCLQKDPSIRLHDIADARIEIGESIGQPLETVPVARRFSLGWLAAGAAAILLAGLLIDLAVRKSAPSFPVVRAEIKLEPGHWLDGWRWSSPVGFDQPTRTAMAISSDGRFIVYSAVKGNPGPQDVPRLYLRRTDQLEAKPLAGTEGGFNPFLSPDDRWVGFSNGDKLMKVTIDGGVAVPLCDAPFSLGASWGSDGSIVFPAYGFSGLSRVSADGGRPETLTTPDPANEELCHRFPHWLPDNKGVLFTIMRGWQDSQPRVALLDLKTRKWSVLLEDAADARYIPTGHLVFLRQGTLMVVPFNIKKLQLAGQPVPALANVMQAINIPYVGWGTAAGQFSVSDSGWLVYAPGGIMPDWENTLVWMDQKGTAQPVTSFKAPFYTPRLSPDGRRIAYTALGSRCQVWIYDFGRGTTSLLSGEGNASQAIWTPDGKRVVFNWSKSGHPNLYWQSADGSSAPERLTTSDHYQAPASFSPDGATLAFVEWKPDADLDILLLDLRSRLVKPFLNSRAAEFYPEISPDGRWMAYVSEESGRPEVYVRDFPGPGGKWLISAEGGSEPLWAHNGKQLFYRSLDNQQVWEVDVRTDGGFSTRKPRLLFNEQGFPEGWPIRRWDISPNGQRFLMVKQEERKPQPVTELVLIQNWFEELKRLAPTGKR